MKYLIFLLTALTFFGCDNSLKKSEDIVNNASEEIHLEYDHIVLFINDSTIKDSLDLLFTPAQNLITKHDVQGTIGYYYLFYNTYIELIFLTDSTNAKLNKDNFGSDYISRWNKHGNSCPIGFGMSISPWDTTTLNKEFHVYRSNDSPEGEFYLMSNYNKSLQQPLVYVSMPHRKYKSLKSLDEINQRPEEIRTDLKNYLTHSSQVKNISRIVYSSKMKNNDNLNYLKNNTMVQCIKADSTSLTLTFDNNTKKQKSIQTQ